MSEQQSYSEQIQKMCPTMGDLLVVTSPHPLTMDQRQKMRSSLEPLADRLGVQLLVLDGGVAAQLQPGMHSLLEEQRKQTAILERMEQQQSLLIQALADDEPEDPDVQPLTYIDGSPCR